MHIFTLGHTCSEVASFSCPRPQLLLLKTQRKGVTVAKDWLLLVVLIGRADPIDQACLNWLVWCWIHVI